MYIQIVLQAESFNIAVVNSPNIKTTLTKYYDNCKFFNAVANLINILRS